MEVAEAVEIIVDNNSGEEVVKVQTEKTEAEEVVKVQTEETEAEEDGEETETDWSLLQSWLSRA